MRYAIKAWPKTIVLDIKLLSSCGNYRPDRIMINGAVATRDPEWSATAGGNILYYKAKDGKHYPIEQKAIFECKEIIEDNE